MRQKDIWAVLFVPGYGQKPYNSSYILRYPVPAAVISAGICLRELPFRISINAAGAVETLRPPPKPVMPKSPPGVDFWALYRRFYIRSVHNQVWQR
jgi:hypothetical protein